MMSKNTHPTDLLANGGCFLCGNPNDLIDTGGNIWQEGHLVLDIACILSLARAAGMELSDQTLKDDLTAAVESLANVTGELARKNQILAELGESAQVKEHESEEAQRALAELRRERIEKGLDPDTGRFLSKMEKAALLAMDELRPASA